MHECPKARADRADPTTSQLSDPVGWYSVFGMVSMTSDVISCFHLAINIMPYVRSRYFQPHTWNHHDKGCLIECRHLRKLSWSLI